MHDRPKQVAVSIPSIGDSLGLKLLPFVLSLVAGSADIIGFLGLHGLLTAHITGNLVILAARLVAHDPAPLSYLIAVPVFIVVLAMTKFLAAGLARIGFASLLPLLFLQFILLFAFYAVCHVAGPYAGPNSAGMIFAGMLGVSAMAVQNALVRISLADAPSTAVMTTNITVFTIDIGEIWFGRDLRHAAKARDRARNTWPAIVGFVLGCALGAVSERSIGLQSLALPTSLALAAFALALSGTSARRLKNAVSDQSQQ